jgi:hypothetical protein
MIYIVTHPKSNIHPLIGELFLNSLQDNGYEVKHTKTIAISTVPCKIGDTCIVVGAGRYIDFNEEQKKSGVIYVLWQTEQLPLKEIIGVGLSRLQTLERILPYYEYYFEYNQVHIPFMESRGWTVNGCIPLGYHKSIDYTKRFKKVNPDYDAIFIGGLRGRRINLLKSLANKCKLHPKTNAWGDGFYKAIYEANIGLNIHLENIDTFESWRIINFLCNKRLIISEPIVGLEPFVNREHLIISPRDEFIGAVRKCSREFKKYRMIAKEGYNFVRNNYRFNDMTKKMMEILT